MASSGSNNVDVERLILIVQNHYEIFDTRDPKHRDREHIGSIWKGIANELNCDEADVRSKWHNLRSNYAREKRKLKLTPADPSGKANVHIKWPYFDAMRFLDGFMKPNESPGNESETFDIAQFTTNEAGDLVSFKSNASTPSTSKSVKKRQSLSIDKIDALYLKHLEKIINNNNDPDLLYLKSLLPMMKQLTTLKSLEFKGEVITLLKNKLQSQENYSNTNTAGPSEYTTAYL